MDNHLDYFDNCPIGTVYEITVNYGAELVGETSAYVKFKKKVIETALKKYDGKLSKQVVTSLKEWNYEL